MMRRALRVDTFYDTVMPRFGEERRAYATP